MAKPNRNQNGSPSRPNSHQNGGQNGILEGIGLLFLAHVFAIVAGFLVFSFANALSGISAFFQQIVLLLLLAFLFLGISQLLYVIPILIRLQLQGQYGRLKGVLIGALLTAIIDAGCVYLLAQIFGFLRH
jgi:hypothetical protein